MNNDLVTKMATGWKRAYRELPAGLERKAMILRLKAGALTYGNECAASCRKALADLEREAA